MLYIEVPDLHAEPSWMDVTESVLDRVCKAARENKVDFVAFPGDLYDKTFLVSDRGGINRLRAAIKKLTAICPVVAVYGTPSHEAPGSLHALADLGLVILEAGKVYGLYDDNKCGHVSVLNTDAGYMKPSAILFGIPELNKQTIQAALGLSAEQANAEAVNLFNRYVAEFIAPRRAMHLDIPAVALLHGNVSDASRENESDIILRASDIVIKTESLAVANIDRWSLGHIHTPWESSVISAGYAGYPGIDRNPWGKTGFLPAMNLVEINGQTTITRIPYGTPERRKIYTPLKNYDPSVAYWLETTDPNATLPETVHPWSRVTVTAERTETRRVTKEQAGDIKTLRDLFKLIDPEVTTPVLEKVDTIESAIGKRQKSPVNVRLEAVEVSGCVLFKGDVKLDLNALNPGITGIRGDNGDGKSSLLAFCTPYPVIVGKDTESGRPSAIKDFFTSEPAKIKKTFTSNGQRHEHLITIKAPHTQNPKTECYLTIDGQPQLEKGTFDEMFTECEKLYGSFNDYLLTSFYVQPLQGKTKAGLMEASMTDIRDLVQSIAGIDREAEKRHALDKTQEIKSQIADVNSWLATVSEFAIDEAELLQQLEFARSTLTDAEHNQKMIESRGREAREKHTAAQAAYNESERQRERKNQDEAKSASINAQIASANARMQESSRLLSNKSDSELQLATDDKNRESNRKIEEIENANSRLKREWQQRVDSALAAIRESNRALKSEYENMVSERKSIWSKLTTEMESARIKIDALNNPCKQCGYIEQDAADAIKKLNNTIALCERDLLVLNQPTQPVYAPETHYIAEPAYNEVPKRLTTLDQSQRSALESQIINARAAQQRIPELEAQIERLKTDMAALGLQFYLIDDAATSSLTQAVADLERSMADYQHAARMVAEKSAEVKTLSEKLAKARELSVKITSRKSELSELQAGYDHWQYIVAMLQASKIPALELELVIESIDDEANRIIEPFLESRYSFRTETQRQGKAGSVDKFDIKIHDNETGIEKSLLKYSPGEKSFFADAYTKALVRQRNEIAHRTYNPVIMDESDGPIQPERISAYYEMQRRFWNDTKVLIVSHNPASHEHIENMVFVRDLITNR
jgi:DNA repair exonuclease SbcCD ATPase subunit/DNA repair exonuclease SbcCD nuclease subunit